MSLRCVTLGACVLLSWGCAANGSSTSNDQRQPRSSPVEARANPPAEAVAVTTPPPSVERATAEAYAYVRNAMLITAHQTPSQQLGPLWILPSFNEAWHIHGGDDARISSLTWALYNPTDAPIQLELRKVELLTGHCVQPGWLSAKPLKLGETRWFLALDDKAPQQLGARYTIPAKQEIHARSAYEMQRVYNACERFAYRLHVALKDKVHAVEIPLSVVREEPYPGDL